MKKINKSNRIMIIVTFIFLSVFSLALTIGSQTTARWLVALAQTDESLTITTYYPSPMGVYSELQLFPRAAAGTCAAANDEGKMYYDSGTHGLFVCQDVGGTIGIGWQSVGGSSHWTQNGALLYANDNNWSVGIGDDTPIGRLQIAGDEVRIGSSGGGVGVADGDGDLYVQNDLEVDKDAYVAGRLTTKDLTVNGTASMGWEYKVEGCRNCEQVSATCTSGKRLLGGGCNCNGCVSTILISGPSPDPSLESTTWFCKTSKTESLLHAQAICANIN